MPKKSTMCGSGFSGSSAARPAPDAAARTVASAVLPSSSASAVPGQPCGPRLKWLKAGSARRRRRSTARGRSGRRSRTARGRGAGRCSGSGAGSRAGTSSPRHSVSASDTRESIVVVGYSRIASWRQASQVAVELALGARRPRRSRSSSLAGGWAASRASARSALIASVSPRANSQCGIWPTGSSSAVGGRGAEARRPGCPPRPASTYSPTRALEARSTGSRALRACRWRRTSSAERLRQRLVAGGGVAEDARGGRPGWNVRFHGSQPSSRPPSAAAASGSGSSRATPRNARRTRAAAPRRAPPR